MTKQSAQEGIQRVGVYTPMLEISRQARNECLQNLPRPTMTCSWLVTPRTGPSSKRRSRGEFASIGFTASWRNYVPHYLTASRRL